MACPTGKLICQEGVHLHICIRVCDNPPFIEVRGSRVLGCLVANQPSSGGYSSYFDQTRGGIIGIKWKHNISQNRAGVPIYQLFILVLGYGNRHLRIG